MGFERLSVSETPCLLPSCLQAPALLPPGSCLLSPAFRLPPPASSPLSPVSCLLPPPAFCPCLLPSVSCLLPPAFCPLPSASSLLPSAPCLLPCYAESTWLYPIPSSGKNSASPSTTSSPISIRRFRPAVTTLICTSNTWLPAASALTNLSSRAPSRESLSASACV